MGKKAWFTLAAVAAATGLPFANAADGGFSAGAGISYTTGQYGTSTSTDIVAIPFTARYDSDRWTLKATLPWLKITGASSVVPGIGRVGSGNPRARGRGPATTTVESSASGLGDLVTSATYSAYYDSRAMLGIDLTGKVKWGTADADEGLGTGEDDYGAQVDFYKTADRLTGFGGVGYTKMGSTAALPLDNVWNVTVGGSYKMYDADTVGVAYDARQRVSATASPISELTAFWNHRIDRSWKTQAHLLKGFSDGSPNWGAGITAAYAF